MKKTILTTGLAVGLSLSSLAGVQANASEVNVDEAKLAKLAINNPEKLNEAPVQEGAYEISFDLEGTTFKFKSDGERWVWKYAPVGSDFSDFDNSFNNNESYVASAPVVENYSSYETYEAPSYSYNEPSYSYSAPKASAPVASNDGLNWASLAECESGGNPNIVDASGTYHGLYQFDAGTWASVGGTGVASQASAEEQTMRAKMLYAQRGAQPWPNCGAYL